MSRNNPNVEVAREEATKLGAQFSTELSRRNHTIGIICYNGKMRKTSISNNVKDQNIQHIVRKFVRRAIEEMK